MPGNFANSPSRTDATGTSGYERRHSSHVCRTRVLGETGIDTFTIGIIAAAFSNSDSALTAMTTSVCVDLLNTGKDSEEVACRKRKKVHFSLSVLLALFICLVEMLNNKSVIDAIYIIASYTYGPLLGMFAFGLFTRRQTNDRRVPLTAVASHCSAMF